MRDHCNRWRVRTQGQGLGAEADVPMTEPVADRRIGAMPDLNDYSSSLFSDHALDEMRLRGISEVQVVAVLANHGRRELVRPGRIVLSSLLDPDNGGRQYILRVFVDVDRVPPVVVTAYRSSKIAKYWREA
jgi:hypothetical protein